MSLPFPRTVCACPDDIESCKRRPGMLMPDDILPILRKIVSLGLAPDLIVANQYLRATPGATVGRKLPDGALQLFQIPTISPATIDGHRCVFLDADDRCQIHDVAPAGCAYFDAHQSKDEGIPRSLYIHRLIDADDDYATIRSLLIKEDYA